jgi:hypothetical protein
MSIYLIEDNIYKIEGNNKQLLKLGSKFLESRFDKDIEVEIGKEIDKLRDIENKIIKYKLTPKLSAYYLSPYIWIIKNKNSKVSKKFKEFIKKQDIENLEIDKHFTLVFNNTEIRVGNKKIIKLSYKHLSILDELMYMGAKKIFGLKNEQYIEHAGMLDINSSGKVDKIVINTHRNFNAEDDKEILFNYDLPDIKENELIFHTHPPTGGFYGRLEEGLVYDPPSPEDIIHFMENYNDGVVQNSLVVTLEGYYIIKCKKFGLNEISIEEDEYFISKYNKLLYKLQDKAIIGHETKKKNFSKTKDNFFKKINENYLDALNKFLDNYNIEIDFIKRKYNKKIKKHVVLKLYLEIIPVEI